MMRVKGHTSYKDPLRKRTMAEKLAQSRDNEQEADEFALAFITRDGPENAMLAMPAFLLSAVLSCGKEEEVSSTHPSAAWRWSILVQALKQSIARDSEWRRYLRETGQVDTYMKLVEQMGTAFDR